MTFVERSFWKCDICGQIDGESETVRGADDIGRSGVSFTPEGWYSEGFFAICYRHPEEIAKRRESKNA